MSPILRLEYACTRAEMDQAQSLPLRHQLGGGSKWRTNLVLFAMLLGMLLGTWFRFREIPEGKRALMLGAIVGGSVLFVFLKRRFRKKIAPDTAQLEISETDITILGAGSRVVLPWSAVSECLESPDLFVLLDRPKETCIIVPKRAFPGESWQTWFREQATNAPNLTTPAWGEIPAPAHTLPAGGLRLTVHLRYRDYLVRTIASWRTWGMCLALGGLLLGIFLYSAAHPPPNAVNSSAKVLVIFIIPFFLFLVMMVVMMFSILPWRLHAKYAGPQEIALSDQFIAFSSADGNGVLPWTTYEHYKETPWSFILWRGSHWMLLPKRAFVSWHDLNLCREMLDRHLKQSRWFVG